MPPSHKTTTATPDGEDRGQGKPLGTHTVRFRKTKAMLSRENLNRGYYSMADHAWYGMGDVWWALTHPHKAIARHVGHLSMLVVILSGFSAVGYLLFEEPNTAKLSLEEPGSLLKVAVDQVVRPTGRFLKRMGGTTVDTLSQDESGYQGEDYRE